MLSAIKKTLRESKIWNHQYFYFSLARLSKPVGNYTVCVDISVTMISLTLYVTT